MAADEGSAYANLVCAHVLPAQPQDFPSSHSGVNRAGQRAEEVRLLLSSEREQLPDFWARPCIDVARFVFESPCDSRHDPPGAEDWISIQQPFLEV